MYVGFKPGAGSSGIWRCRFQKFLLCGKLIPEFPIFWNPIPEFPTFRPFRPFRISEIRVRNVWNSGLFSTSRGGSATLSTCTLTHHLRCVDDEARDISIAWCIQAHASVLSAHIGIHLYNIFAKHSHNVKRFWIKNDAEVIPTPNLHPYWIKTVRKRNICVLNGVCYGQQFHIKCSKPADPASMFLTRHCI